MIDSKGIPLYPVCISVQLWVLGSLPTLWPQIGRGVQGVAGGKRSGKRWGARAGVDSWRGIRYTPQYECENDKKR